MPNAANDIQHLLRPLSREQCYLCIMTLVPDPPGDVAQKETLKGEHKKFLSNLENEGRIFGAGRLCNDAEGETSEIGYGMFILRASSLKEAEEIALQEPCTKAGHRTMKLYPWQRTEGDINIRISFTNGSMTIDRREFAISGA